MSVRKIIIFVFLGLCFLTGCGRTADIMSSSENEYKHPWIVSIETAEQFEEYLIAKDAEAISKMFCDAKAVTTSEIQSLLNMIEGQIVSLEEGPVSSGLKESYNGVYTIYTYAACCNIYTNTNNKYLISISAVAEWNDCPELVGIDGIAIINEQTGERYDI